MHYAIYFIEANSFFILDPYIDMKKKNVLEK